MTRFSDQSIRVSWGTPSGSWVSPMVSMQSHFGCPFGHGQPIHFPQLSTQDDVWMFDVDTGSFNGAMCASFINPLNDDALTQMCQMIRFAKIGDSNIQSATRLAANNYVYLGWVIGSDQEIPAFKHALEKRASVALNENLQSSNGIFYRLSPGVEKSLASNPNDGTELAKLRRSMPIMFEVMKSQASKPRGEMHVLYLDGHIECVPMGSRFPATQAFVDAFQPPKL